MIDKNAHCGYCGSKYTSDLWPRYCTSCQNTTWRNPVPVTVIRAIIVSNNEYNMLLVRRSINPHKGEWALPGGYLDYGESWAEGAARELFEETGTKVDNDKFTLSKIITSPLNSNLLLFCDVWLFESELSPFVPNNEVSEIMVAKAPVQLAFPTHTEMMEKFFNLYLPR